MLLEIIIRRKKKLLNKTYKPTKHIPNMQTTLKNKPIKYIYL